MKANRFHDVKYLTDCKLVYVHDKAFGVQQGVNDEAFGLNDTETKKKETKKKETKKKGLKEEGLEKTEKIVKEKRYYILLRGVDL